jgi:hypothetical protein
MTTLVRQHGFVNYQNQAVVLLHAQHQPHLNSSLAEPSSCSHHEDAGLGNAASSHSCARLPTFHPAPEAPTARSRGGIRFSASRGPLILQVA